MQKFKETVTHVLDALICDCCGREAKVGGLDFEAAEFVSIDFVGGYQSIFGDGTHVSLDICQHCLKDKFGTCIKT